METPNHQPTINRPAFGLTAAGLALAVAIALVATYYPVFDRRTQILYSTNPDALQIIKGAKDATTEDVIGWWTGHWIQENSHFYRPLSSMLMWAEYHLWGRDFQKYCVLSWIVHALNCALLYLLMFRLSRERGPWVAAGLGVLAVALFCLRRGIKGPGWIPARVVYGEMPYWPSQTDIFSLAFSLGSLHILNLYSLRQRARWLALAALLFVIALLFKEMALTMVLVGPLLVWHRRRGFPWIVGGMFLALGLGLLLIRALAVPVAEYPEVPGLAWVGLSILYYLHYDLFVLVGAGMYWQMGAATGLLALLYVVRRYRISGIWLLLGVLVWPPLMAQALNGNFALVVIPRDFAALLLALLFVGGLVVLIRSRSTVAWMLAGMVVAVHLPILFLRGPHYLYWPAAFWGMLSACLVILAYDQWQALEQSPGTVNQASERS